MNRFNFLLSALLLSILSTNLSAETVNALLDKANKAQQQREYSTALIHLKNAVREEPDNVSIRLQMARIFITTGQGVQADVELDKARSLGAKPVDTAVLSAKSKLLQGEFGQLTENINLIDLPQSEIAKLRAIQGHAFFEQREFSKALQMYQRAVRLSPGELEVELGRAKMFRINGEAENERQQVIKLLKSYPDNADVLIVAGNYYRIHSNYEKSLELFNQAGAIQPSNVNVWFGVVRAHIGAQNYNDAKIEIEKVLKNFPEHQVGNYLLAVIAFEERNFDRAKAAIDIVLKGEKRNFEAMKLQSIIFLQQGKYSESEKAIKKYLQFHPGDVSAQKTLASVYLKRKQGTLALEILKPLEKLNDAYIYSMIATAYLYLGNTDKSNQYVEKSFEIAPQDNVIKKHFQRSKLEAGEIIDAEFTDTHYENFLAEGYIPFLNLLRSKKYELAIEIINGYLAKSPNSALLHYMLGSTYRYQGDMNKAKAAFEKSLVLNPSFIESRINLAKILQFEGNDRGAEKEYREVLRLKPDNDQSMIAMAGILKRAGNENEMLKWLMRSRRTNSASLASREVLEDYYRSKGERKSALEIANEMVGIQPENVKLLLKLANNQKAVNRLDLAIKSFEKIVTLKPELPSAWLGLGRLQFINKDWLNAKASYEKVLVLAPDNLIAKVVLVQIDLQSNQLQAAFDKAKLLQRQHPDSPAGFDLLGDIYIAMKQPEKAIAQYQRSVKMQYDSQTYIKLYTAFNRSNQESRGLKLLEKWVKTYPKDLRLKEVLAITYQRSGRWEEARVLFEGIAKKSPKNDRVLNNLAQVTLQLKSPMSIEYAEMAYNLNTRSAQNKDTLGWVLLNTGNPEKGFTLLKEAIATAPEDSNIRYHYAVALSNLGKNNLAVNQLNIAIGTNKSFSNREKAMQLLNQIKKGG